jgi:hypothetical protein
LLGIEVKASAAPRLRNVTGMQAFLDEHPRQAMGGVVLHGGNDSYWMDERILAVPWWRVL